MSSGVGWIGPAHQCSARVTAPGPNSGETLLRHKPLFAAVGAACSALLLVTPLPASATPKVPTPELISSNLAAPFNIDFKDHAPYVADGGLNQVVRVRPDGSLKPIVSDAPGTSGLAFSKYGEYMAYTTTITEGDEPPGTITKSGLNIKKRHKAPVYADTLAYEKANNPDQHVKYGVRHPSPCVKEELTKVFGQASYKGLVDSHAYSVARYKKKWVVADAGGNDLLWVTNRGKIRTLAVLPSQPAKITQEFADANKLRDCVVGVTYKFEAVPTDVEVGRDDYLYVTTLPGGPEDPSLGARGKVYRVNPRNGHIKLVASGFLGATNLAIGKHGKIFVAELFGGQISAIKHGKADKYLSLPGVVAVETDRSGALWAATLGNDKPPAPGTLVKIVKVSANP
jgi:hypothetical protein